MKTMRKRDYYTNTIDEVGRETINQALRCGRNQRNDEDDDAFHYIMTAKA